MVKSLTILTISLLTTILITGGLSAIPYAYSSGPDTLKVKYLGPIADDPVVTTIQIYKKIDDFGSPPLGPEITITNEVGGDEFMVISQNYGKDKLNSNTVFRILVDGEQIDVAEIHTSCSKPLYIGQIVVGQEGLVTLEVIDGTLGGDENSILPNTADEKCIDNKDSKNTATIILKKAVTTDNGEIVPLAEVECADISGQELINCNNTNYFKPKIDDLPVSFGEPIPITSKEPHFISELEPDRFSFVLIAGDTECPSMLGEEFTVKKNKEITCTIYNDDNFVPGQTGEPSDSGVIFDFGFVQFVPSQVFADGFDACPAVITAPCIEDRSVGFLIIPKFDPAVTQELTRTTLILLTVQDITTPDRNIGCQVTGVDTAKQGFIIFCPDLLGLDAEGDTYSANYALIETDRNA